MYKSQEMTLAMGFLNQPDQRQCVHTTSATLACTINRKLGEGA